MFMLTFDDGPYRLAWNAGSNPPQPTMDCPANATSTIVSKLAATWVDGVPVTAAFFVVGHDGSGRVPGLPVYDPVTMTEGVDGYTVSNADLVQLENSAGHTVGNHTNTHPLFTLLTPVATVENEIQACEDQIAAAGVPIVRLFRPPYLADWASVRQGASNKGYSIIWGSTHNDWEPAATWQGVAGSIVSHLTNVWNTRDEPWRKPLPDVVILHDPGPPTARSLQEIVDYVRDRGFVLVQFDSQRVSTKNNYYTHPDEDP